jgi:hypothetical protein
MDIALKPDTNENNNISATMSRWFSYEVNTSYFCFPFLLQVSWIRRKDYHLLTVGLATYSSDDRFLVEHARHLQVPTHLTLIITYCSSVRLQCWRQPGLQKLKLYSKLTRLMVWGKIATNATSRYCLVQCIATFFFLSPTP